MQIFLQFSKVLKQTNFDFKNILFREKFCVFQIEYLTNSGYKIQR